MFDHNFSLQSAGQRSSASSAGYAGATRGIGIEGAGFWFRGPNNYIRNNVAASAATYGFALPEGLRSVRTPAFKGADTSQADEAVRVDMTAAAVLEFTNNEAYGRFETGLEWVWNGVVSNFTVWHPSHHGFNGIPPDQLTLGAVTVRGDLAVIDDPAENPVGIAIGNYISRQVKVTGADVQAMRVGVLSPFFYGQTPAPGTRGRLIGGRERVFREPDRRQHCDGVHLQRRRWGAGQDRGSAKLRVRDFQPTGGERLARRVDLDELGDEASRHPAA